MTLEFCSISIERSKNDSSREDTWNSVRLWEAHRTRVTYSFARQAACFACEDPLEEFMHKGGVLRMSSGIRTGGSDDRRR